MLGADGRVQVLALDGDSAWARGDRKAEPCAWSCHALHLVEHRMNIVDQQVLHRIEARDDIGDAVEQAGRVHGLGDVGFGEGEVDAEAVEAQSAEVMDEVVSAAAEVDDEPWLPSLDDWDGALAVVG